MCLLFVASLKLLKSWKNFDSRGFDTTFTFFSDFVIWMQGFLHIIHILKDAVPSYSCITFFNLYIKIIRWFLHCWLVFNTACQKEVSRDQMSVKCLGNDYWNLLGDPEDIICLGNHFNMAKSEGLTRCCWWFRPAGFSLMSTGIYQQTSVDISETIRKKLA
jgi:hypothetical protein